MYQESHTQEVNKCYKLEFILNKETQVSNTDLKIDGSFGDVTFEPRDLSLNNILDSSPPTCSNKFELPSIDTISSKQEMYKPNSTHEGNSKFKFKPERPRRKRANAMQIKVLEQIFQTTCFPTTQLRNKLGVQLGMEPRSVQIWFQNKRQSLNIKHHCMNFESQTFPGLFNFNNTNTGFPQPHLVPSMHLRNNALIFPNNKFVQSPHQSPSQYLCNEYDRRPFKTL